MARTKKFGIKSISPPATETTSLAQKAESLKLSNKKYYVADVRQGVSVEYLAEKKPA